MILSDRSAGWCDPEQTGLQIRTLRRRLRDNVADGLSISWVAVLCGSGQRERETQRLVEQGYMKGVRGVQNRIS